MPRAPSGWFSSSVIAVTLLFGSAALAQGEGEKKPEASEEKKEEGKKEEHAVQTKQRMIV